jgi:hypothetical protein
VRQVRHIITYHRINESCCLGRRLVGWLAVKSGPEARGSDKGSSVCLRFARGFMWHGSGDTQITNTRSTFQKWIAFFSLTCTNVPAKTKTEFTNFVRFYTAVSTFPVFICHLCTLTVDSSLLSCFPVSRQGLASYWIPDSDSFVFRSNQTPDGAKSGKIMWQPFRVNSWHK